MTDHTEDRESLSYSSVYPIPRLLLDSDVLRHTRQSMYSFVVHLVTESKVDVLEFRRILYLLLQNHH